VTGGVGECCCSVLQMVLQCVADGVAVCCTRCCSVLQVCCVCVLQDVASVLQCVAVCCSVLQCVASMLQRVAVC